MTEHELRIAESIAAEWNRRGIPYAVVHGLERYPSSLGRRLEVLIAEAHLKPALSVACDVLANAGWRVALPSTPWGKRIVAFRDEHAFSIHFFKALSWRGIVLAQGSDAAPTRRVGPFEIDPWASFAKSVLLPVLALDGERFRDEAANDLSRFSGDAGLLAKPLRRLCHPQLASSMLTATARGDGEALARLAPEIRRSILGRQLREAPISVVRGIAGSVLRRMKQPFSPCGPIVAVVGPDGAGKSTLIGILRERHRLEFTDVVIRHWRPNVLPGVRALLNRSHRGASLTPSPPRRRPGRWHLMRLAYYTTDVVLGFFVKDRVDSSCQRLVLYDRCYLDMVVDPFRYALSSTFGIRTLWRWMPKPDLVILVKGDPHVIFRRKPELPTHEIERQFAEWDELVRQGEVHATLNGDRSPEELAREATSLILDAFIRRHPPEPHRDLQSSTRRGPRPGDGRSS